MDYAITGSVTPREGGGWDVDIRGTIDGQAVTIKRAKTSTVAAKTEGDVASEIESCQQEMGETLARLAGDMVDLLARENKSGKVSVSRTLTEIYRPFTVALAKYPVDALVFGAEQAIGKGIPNVNYAKKAAASYVEEGRAATPVSNAPVVGRYDVIGDDSE